MNYKSEDIKKLNSLSLLKTIYDFKNATMLELVETTQFSQSSVRGILKELESKRVLSLQEIDQSSGGRCPGRYTFTKSNFQILSVFIDEGTVEIVLKDILNNIILHSHIACELNIELEKIIIDIANKYKINCISIASSGVVQDECFYTDHGDYMMKHEIALNLKKQLKMPIIIENDVKCMMMGIQSKAHYNNLAYIYMSQTGVGSAYYTQKDIMRGSQSFSGELGLLPYQTKTINQVIANKPTNEVINDIYILLLTTIAVTIDPSKVIIADKNPFLDISTITKGVTRYLSKRYVIDIEKSLDPLEDCMNGLHYLGILKLFDIYTDYKRSNKNG